MELLIWVVVFGVFAVLAIRHGADSRESAYSKEKELADLGLVPEAPTTSAADLNGRSDDVAAAATADLPAEAAVTPALGR